LIPQFLALAEFEPQRCIARQFADGKSKSCAVLRCNNDTALGHGR
jgi:hypothetical protein